MSRHEDRKRDKKKSRKNQERKRASEMPACAALSKPVAEDAEYDCRLDDGPAECTHITILTGPFKGMSYLSDEDEAD